MKKVLVITYYWPPAGGAGVQRTLKFTKYLHEFGWHPFVLTVEKPDAPVYDDALLNDVDEQTVIFKTRALEPFSFYKKFTGKNAEDKIPADILMKKDTSVKEKIAKFIRANFFIPDAKIGWLPYALKEGKRIIEREKIDLIYASSPPATVALIGYKLSKATGVKFVADFRDPWLEIVYNQTMKRSALTVAIDSRLEKKVLRNADTLVTVSKGFAELLQRKAPEQRIVVIPNGYDEDDFPALNKTKNEKFTVAYTGVMSPDRVPYSFLHAFSALVKEGFDKMECVCAGKFADEFVSEIKRLHLEDYFNMKGFVPHSESVKILLKADALLLVVNKVPDSTGILPGKMLEYLGCRKPVFAVGTVGGEADEILKETDSGITVGHDDIENAYTVLKTFYNDWEKQRQRFTFNVNDFSRRKLTEKLSRVFSEIVG